MIAPTVRHAIRISSVTALFEHWVANQATCSSNTVVWPVACRAHGTARTVGPWSGQFTRGASASSHTGIVPRSKVRHRRRPSPRSYHGERRPQRPQPLEARRVGRTHATRTCSSSSYSIPSTTVFSTPNTARHKVAFCTPFSAHWLLTLDKPET